MKPLTEIVNEVRRQFPALSREMAGQPMTYLDGPAGTQTPQRVIEAISHYLAHTNANTGGHFATSRESDRVLEQAHAAVADLLGARDPHTVIFGANMTSLTFALSRSIGRTWKAGDEVLLTRLDHDANFTPWLLAAQDSHATVHVVDYRADDLTLDAEDFKRKLTPKTKLVAFGCASNATGAYTPYRELAAMAHEVGATVVMDAVHYAPHARMRVEEMGCDFLLCSAYKFFGPHLGVMWGKRELLERYTAYKVRPAPNTLPGKWMTGTQSHEAIAGTLAAVEYLADLGYETSATDGLDRSGAIDEAFRQISAYERTLTERFLRGITRLESFRLLGIADPARASERAPTFSLVPRTRSASECADYLAKLGIFAWHGNFYALNLSESLGLEPGGMLRIGAVHYNTETEIDRVLQALEDFG